MLGLECSVNSAALRIRFVSQCQPDYRLDPEGLVLHVSYLPPDLTMPLELGIRWDGTVLAGTISSSTANPIVPHSLEELHLALGLTHLKDMNFNLPLPILLQPGDATMYGLWSPEKVLDPLRGDSLGVVSIRSNYCIKERRVISIRVPATLLAATPGLGDRPEKLLEVTFAPRPDLLPWDVEEFATVQISVPAREGLSLPLKDTPSPR